MARYIDIGTLAKRGGISKRDAMELVVDGDLEISGTGPEGEVLVEEAEALAAVRDLFTDEDSEESDTDLEDEDSEESEDDLEDEDEDSDD